MKITQYIDLAKKKEEVRSDYQLSKILGVGRSAISNYRKETRVMDDYVCFQLADMIGIDPLEIIIASNLVREKNKDKKAFWQDRYDLLPNKAFGFASVNFQLFTTASFSAVALIYWLLC